MKPHQAQDANLAQMFNFFPLLFIRKFHFPLSNLSYPSLAKRVDHVQLNATIYG